MKKSLPFLKTLTVIGLSATCAVASAQVIYLENYTNGSDSGSALTQVRWNSIGIGRTSIGVDNAIYTSDTPQIVLQTSSSGTNPGPQNTLAGINNAGTFASPTNGSAGTGFVFVNANNYKAFLAYAGGGLEYFGAGRTLASGNLSQIRIQSGLTTTGSAGTFVPAVQVGSQWYVYTGSVSNVPTTVAGASAFTSSSAYNTWGSSVFSSNLWATLDTTTVTSNAFTVGSNVALPTGNVNAVGVYGFGFGTGGNFRLDNFEVTVIPEPSSMALLAGAGVALFLVKRRRR